MDESIKDFGRTEDKMVKDSFSIRKTKHGKRDCGVTERESGGLSNNNLSY
jgi:hypothetical protein